MLVLVSVFFTVINKKTNKNHTQKLKEKKRGRVGREQPSSTTGPSPASVLVLSLWLAPAVSFLSRVLRVSRSYTFKDPRLRT